jgi:MFS family permease
MNTLDLLLVYVQDVAEPKLIAKLTTWLSLGLVIVAGAANGFMDRLQHHYGTIPDSLDEQFWNPKESWRNKWKNGDHTQGEKFLFSSTLLVALTDGWHMTKEIMLSALALSIALSLNLVFIDNEFVNNLLLFIAIRVLFGIGFKILYR